MLRTILIAAALGMAAGCLSTPPPASGTTDADIDAPVTDAPVNDAAVTDAPPTSVCGAVGQFTATAWPPAKPMQVGIRNVLTADINNDGNADLIVPNTEVSDTNDYGIFIMLGPQSDPNTLQYHLFVPTVVVPWAVVATDLGGDGCVDLVAFGANKTNTAGIVEVLEFRTDTRTFSSEVQKDVGFIPLGDGAPVSMVLGDFDGDGAVYDVVVSDLTTLRLLKNGQSIFQNLPTSVPVNVGPSGAPGSWTDANGLFARFSVGSGLTSDDLVVIEQHAITWLKNDGNGNFGNATTGSSSGIFVSRAIQEVDLDGVPPLDFIGGAGDSFGAYLISTTGETVNIATRNWNAVFGVYNELDDILVADLGGTTEPELVVIEADQPAFKGAAFASLVNNLFDAGSELMPTTAVPYSFNMEIDAIVGVVSDFNADQSPEVWVFEQSGGVRCIRRRPANPELEACP